jgi:hypothetical protein
MTGRSGIALILDVKNELSYQMEFEKQANTFTINKRFSICSFGEIIQELIKPNSKTFVLILSFPFTLRLDAIIDPKRKTQTVLRFINTRNPYTCQMKDVFKDVSIFIGEIAKEIEADMNFSLTESQKEGLMYLPKSIRTLVLYSPLLLELMKHKIEIEVNSNQFETREVLYVFLVSIERDGLSKPS